MSGGEVFCGSKKTTNQDVRVNQNAGGERQKHIQDVRFSHELMMQDKRASNEDESYEFMVQDTNPQVTKIRAISWRCETNAQVMKLAVTLPVGITQRISLILAIS